jgi:O-antigen/teichoic acid export membrane protein
MIGMNIVRRVAKNSIALFISGMIVSILSIILSIVIARNLGIVIFGKYAFAIAFVTLFEQFSDLGYTTLSIRNISREKTQASKYISNNFSIRVLLSIILFALIVFTINILNYPTDTKYAVYFFGVFVLATTLSGVFNVAFRAFEKMEYESTIAILTQILRTALCILILFLGFGLLELALISAFVGIFTFLVSFIICEKNFVKMKIELDFSFLKNTIKIALPFFAVSLFGFIYLRIDTIMLSLMKGDAAVGWYNAATSLTYGLKSVPHIFMSALLPLMSYYFVTSKDVLKNAFQKSFKYLLILGLPIAVGTSLLSNNIILFFYGQQYVNSIIVLQILAWDILLIFLYTCLAFLMISTNKQYQMAILAGSTALINVVLNLFLIPYFSYTGAAIATIAAEGFLLLSYFYLSFRYFDKGSLQKIVLKPILACVVMGFFVYTFHNSNLILLILIAALLYFGMLYLIKGFSDEDISLLKKLIKK